MGKNLLIRIFNRISNLLLYIHNVYRVIRDKGHCNVSFLDRIKANLKGFRSDQWIYYNLSNNDPKEYISDFEWYFTKDINRQYRVIMDNKLIFTEIFSKYLDVPEVYFYIKNGKLSNFCSNKNLTYEIIEKINKKKNLILKPVIGGEGLNVHLISKSMMEYKKNLQNNPDLLYFDNQLIDIKKLMSLLSCMDEYIITEFIEQHNYAEKLYNRTTNTIRLITLNNPSTGKIIIPDAIHRIGRDASFPVDNFSKGGLSVEIGLDSGCLGRAASFYNYQGKKLIHLSNHPDTNEHITGITVPYWDKIKSKLIEIASKFPYIFFIAWDIVVTEKGFSVIEINRSSGLNIFQIFGGMRNSNLGDFYRFHQRIK